MRSRFRRLSWAILLCAAWLSGSVAFADTAAPAAAATDALTSQTDAWNRGDLEAFTAMYAADCTFVTPNGITRGRDAVLQRYRARYPDRAAMGTLTLDVEEARTLRSAADGAVAAVAVVARWTLAYPAAAGREQATGWTLVVLERSPAGGWAIVQDASM